MRGEPHAASRGAALPQLGDECRLARGARAAGGGEPHAEARSEVWGKRVPSVSLVGTSNSGSFNGNQQEIFGESCALATLWNLQK